MALASEAVARVSPRIWWSVTAAYTLVLTLMTHVPLKTYVPEEHLQTVVVWDKSEHVVAYAGLSGLIAMSLLASGRARWAWWLAPLAAAAFGALDEITQPLCGRQARFDDWLANLLGSLLGTAVALGLAAALRHRRRSRAAQAPAGDVG